MSDAAFTDSTTAQTSPAFTFRPTAGNSMNTRSPSACCAWSVMPIVSVPSSPTRIHSWLAVYFKSAGTFMSEPPVVSFNENLAVTNERRLDDARGKLPVPDVNAHGVAGRDSNRHPRKRNRHAQRRGKRAAGDFAVAGIAAHGLMTAQDTTFVDEQQTE